MMGGSGQSAVGNGRCPHCGQVVHKAPRELVEMLSGLRLYGQERRLVDALLSTWPRLATTDALLAALWDRRDVELAAPENTMQSYASKLRRKIEPHGWTIETRRGSGRQFARLPTADCRLPERGS